MTSTIGQYQRHLAQFANGNLGSAFTFDLLTNGIYQSGVLNAATCAISFTTPRVHTTLFVELIQDATGGRAVTYSGSVVGTQPPINTAPNASTLLELVYNGTNYQFVSVPATAGTALASAAPVNAAISALSSSVTAALTTLNRFSLQGATSQAYSLLAADAGWSFFASEGWVGNASGASVTFSLGPYPSGCTVDTVQISYRPSAFGSTHGTHLPLNQPTLTLFVFNTAAGATAHSVTDSAGSVAAYETVRTLTLSSLGIPAGVPMWLQLTDESGIHAQPGNQLGRVTVTFD